MPNELKPRLFVVGAPKMRVSNLWKKILLAVLVHESTRSEELDCNAGIEFEGWNRDQDGQQDLLPQIVHAHLRAALFTFLQLERECKCEWV